jgi:hypothetical protein
VALLAVDGRLPAAGGHQNQAATEGQEPEPEHQDEAAQPVLAR